MRRVAIVMQRMVRGGEANSLIQIYTKIQFICLCYKEKSGPVISSWHSIYRPHMHNSAVGLQWQGAAHLYPFRSVFFFKTEPQTSDDYIVSNEVS